MAGCDLSVCNYDGVTAALQSVVGVPYLMRRLGKLLIWADGDSLRSLALGESNPTVRSIWSSFDKNRDCSAGLLQNKVEKGVFWNSFQASSELFCKGRVADFSVYDGCLTNASIQKIAFSQSFMDGANQVEIQMPCL